VDDLLRPRDAARFLAIDVRTLRKWTAEGKVPAVKIPETKHSRYRREDLEALLTK
jgi:excisionase family DNA binding protein